MAVLLLFVDRSGLSGISSAATAGSTRLAGILTSSRSLHLRRPGHRLPQAIRNLYDCATPAVFQPRGCRVPVENGFLPGLTDGLRRSVQGRSSQQEFTLTDRRGVFVDGWQGKSVFIRFAISNSKITQALKQYEWPDKWPYSEADLARTDPSDDNLFYAQPRFVTHIDDAAVNAIRSFYSRHFAQAAQGEFAVLDLCSSWVSHYPKGLQAKRVAITGMNEKELEANQQATEYVVKDLNNDPTLPFEDNQFDFITNVVSVDYLSRPQEVFAEMYRVMKPGGMAIMSFSNRCFPTKAINMWVKDMDDGVGHAQIVGNYFRFNPSNGWKSIASVDISADPYIGDPMWVVTAIKANPSDVEADNGDIA